MIFWITVGVLSVITFALAVHSGVNADDRVQIDYSNKLIQFYKTFGEDKSALHVEKSDMHYYGGFFEVISGGVNHILGYHENQPAYHHVRHIGIATLGLLAMLFCAFFVRSFAGWGGAWIAFLLIWVSPRFTGDALMNPKDIPFAAGYMMTLYYILCLGKELPTPRRSTIIGCIIGLGIALGTRVGGLLLIGILGMFMGIVYLLGNLEPGTSRNSRLIPFAKWFFIISIGGYLIGLLFWPYGLVSPISNPLAALKEFTKLGVNIKVLFKGENVMSNTTGWDYPVQWILRTIPILTMGGVILLVIFWKKAIRRFGVFPIILALFGAIFPVAYVIYKDSSLYCGWRHLLFMYPPLVICATMGIWLLYDSFSQKSSIKYIIVGVIALLLIEPASFIARNPAYPFIYFNPISGGGSKAAGNFDTDYWGLSVKEAIRWMEKEKILYAGMKDTIRIASNFAYSLDKAIDPSYAAMVIPYYVSFYNRYNQAFDYGIFPSQYIIGSQIRAGYWPNKRSIHVVRAGGAPICTIEKGTDGRMVAIQDALQSGNTNRADSLLTLETQQFPDNETAWSLKSQLYQSQNRMDDALNAIKKAQEIIPDYTQYLFLEANILARQNKVDAAKDILERLVKKEPGFAQGWFFLAQIARATGDLNSAADYIMKTLEANPGYRDAYFLGADIFDALGDHGQAEALRQAAQGQ